MIIQKYTCGQYKHSYVISQILPVISIHKQVVSVAELYSAIKLTIRFVVKLSMERNMVTKQQEQQKQTTHAVVYEVQFRLFCAQGY